MRRVLVLLFSSMTVLGLGCGYAGYEQRLAHTEERIKEQIRLDRFLDSAPEGRFKEFGFFLRPPKPLQATKQFQLIELPEGQFDVEGSFLNLAGATKGAAPPPSMSLHFLGRRKSEKKTAKKGEPPPPARGEFKADVQALLASIYGNAVAEEKVTKVDKKPNLYERHAFGTDGKTIQAHYFNRKIGGDTYDAVLIFEYPDGKAQSTAMDLALSSFAVGTKAARAFQGETVEESADGLTPVGGPVAPGGTSF
jgi:hypothetical protein